MLPRVVPPLFAGAVWALPTAVLAEPCLPLATAIAALGTVLALVRSVPHRFAGLTALPALLAAMPLPSAPPPAPPIGPAWVTGIASGCVRAPDLGLCVLVLGPPTSGLRLTLDGDLEALPGDHVALLAYGTLAPAPGLPASVRGVAGSARITPGPWSLRRLAAAARRALERQLLTRLDGETAALVAALVLGRDTRPASDLQQAHRATGLSHLLAVSGAHAAMLAFLLGLTGWHGRPRPGRSRARTNTLLLLLVVYAAITGCEPPVVRAVAAYAIAAVAMRNGRPCGVGPLLLLPAMLTAMLQPEALLGPSFLLSYAAVAGLALAGTPRQQSAVGLWLLGPLRASAFATLTTAPVTLAFFGQVAPWTVLLTPLLAPMVALLLLLGLATALLGVVVAPLADLLAAPLQALAGGYVAFVRVADLLPGTPVPAAFAAPAWALFFAGFVGACVLACWPTRAGCLATAVVMILPHWLPLSPRPTPALHLFAVGHGQACLVQHGDHATAIDCGSLHAPFVAAERLAEALSRRRLDLLVVTHGDHDHHNGVEGLLARVAIGSAIGPRSLADSPVVDLLRAHGVAVHLLAPGERCTPAPHLVLWAPDLPATATDNDQSLWVSATVAATRVLLPGDAQELGVAAALASNFAAPHDVLVLPHHGRPNAAAPALLRAVRPRACFASAPAADGDTTLGAIARGFGAELWVTGQHGSLRLGGDGPLVFAESPGRPLAAPPRRPPLDN